MHSRFFGAFHLNTSRFDRYVSSLNVKYTFMIIPLPVAFSRRFLKPAHYLVPVDLFVFLLLFIQLHA